MLIPKEGSREVSDGLDEREEEEKVFKEWPKIGWTMEK